MSRLGAALAAVLAAAAGLLQGCFVQVPAPSGPICKSFKFDSGLVPPTAEGGVVDTSKMCDPGYEYQGEAISCNWVDVSCVQEASNFMHCDHIVAFGLNGTGLTKWPEGVDPKIQTKSGTSVDTSSLQVKAAALLDGDKISPDVAMQQKWDIWGAFGGGGGKDARKSNGDAAGSTKMAADQSTKGAVLGATAAAEKVAEKDDESRREMLSDQQMVSDAQGGAKAGVTAGAAVGGASGDAMSQRERLNAMIARAQQAVPERRAEEVAVVPQLDKLAAVTPEPAATKAPEPVAAEAAEPAMPNAAEPGVPKGAESRKERLNAMITSVDLGMASKAAEPAAPAPAAPKALATKSADSTSVLGALFESVLAPSAPKGTAMPEVVTKEKLRCVKVTNNLQMGFLLVGKVPGADSGAKSWFLGTLAAVAAVAGVVMAAVKLHRLRSSRRAREHDVGHSSGGEGGVE